MKKYTGIISSLLVIGFLFTACERIDLEGIGELNKLELWYSPYTSDAAPLPEDCVLIDFVEKDLGISLTAVPLPTNKDEQAEVLLDAAKSNSLPDIFMVNRDVLTTPVRENYVTRVDGLYALMPERTLKMYDDTSIQAASFDGVCYGLSQSGSIDRNEGILIRKDWLDKLNLKEPTTTEEFYETMVAFRDNADTLLGADADKMIPYSISYDVGWRAANLIESYIDPEISTFDFYVNGFDDRKLTEPGTKDALRLLNQWYHEDLLWNDFALYGSGDTTEDDYMKAGYVGAFTHNWDYPFRNGDDSINANLKRTVGEDAEFIAIDPFTDKNGGHTKYVTSTAGDRKIFFPTTNDEQLASLLYLEWISTPEHIQYLQLGDEGVTCNKLDDGAYESVAATGDPIMNSGFNIDYTITCNGLNLMDPEVTAKSISHSYAGIDPEVVDKANKIAQTDAIQETHVNVGVIAAEDGMGTSLGSKRDILYDNVILADPADFDAQWDSYMSDYLSSGGQAIIDERTAKWQAKYGDSKTITE